jgi:iduronate 2-sulfatase
MIILKTFDMQRKSRIYLNANTIFFPLFLNGIRRLSLQFKLKVIVIIPLVLLICSILNPFISYSQVKPKYNVLFIVVDDMNTRVSFLGWPEVKTPNMERLVARGMVLTHAYCQFPLCSPSRTSVMLGWRPDKTGIVDNAVRPSSVLGTGVVYLPEYFKQYGYHIERYGKIMHASFENDITWDYAEPAEKVGSDLSSNSEIISTSTSSYNGQNWWINNVLESHGEDGVEAHHLVARLQQQPLTQPFFYGLGLTKTHNPFTPNLKYWNVNGDPSVQELLPVDANKTLTDLKGNGSENIIIPSTPPSDRSDEPKIAFTGQDILSDSEWKRTIHAYDGEAAQMDSQLGLVLDEMDRQNLWSNTIVVFFSDHGQHLGEHEGLWAKQTLFKESLEVPLIICVPGKEAGVCSRLIELVDLYPTLAELCGLPEPKGMEGSSFAPLLDHPTLNWKKVVFSQVKRTSVMGRSVTTEQYQYNSWGTAGEELFDHYKDPNEYTNLVTNPQYAAVLNDMRTILSNGWTKALPPSCDSSTYFADEDEDGYGNNSDSIFTCSPPVGYVNNKSDCDDNNPAIHPGANEILNGIDDNCNGQIDEQQTFYADTDNDGFGDPANSTQSDSAPQGYVINNEDCNDNNAAIHPGALEICDGVDNNCDGQVDENKITAVVSPGGTVSICKGSSILLSANTGSNINYQWRKNGTNIQGATNLSFTATTAGNYTVSETNNFTCKSISAATTIKIVSLPSATITALGSLDICSAGSVTLQATTGSGLNYQWLRNNVAIANAISSSFIATRTGTYKVTVTNSNGCSKQSKGVSVTNSCGKFALNSKSSLFRSTEDSHKIFLYPNPSKGDITVVVNSKHSGPVSFQVLDLRGKAIFSKTAALIKGNNTFHISLNGLVSGMYYLELKNNKEQNFVKFIIEK